MNNRISGKVVHFADISEPRMVALVPGNGTGSKVFQGFFDGHPDLYMIPAYPLTYFYPHWELWKIELSKSYNWKSIIDKFCEKHGSILDSRKIPGPNGLRSLGEDQNEFVVIDEKLFREVLSNLLKYEDISSRAFLLSVHYAYAICKGQDLSNKKVLFYHIHIYYYLDNLFLDFPNLKLFVMTRDLRASLKGRISSAYNFDVEKLNMTDAIKFQRYLYLTAIKAYSWNLYKTMKSIKFNNMKVIKHEDLYYNPEKILKLCCNWIDIKFVEELKSVTFDNKTWWGDKIYNMPPTKGVFKRTVSKEWKNSISKRDWFVLEGVFWDCYQTYKYKSELYSRDNLFNRLLLVFVILLPMKYEVSYIYKMFNYKEHYKFLKYAYKESTGDIALVNYTWNGSYLFKNIYKPLKLWKPRWFRVFWLKYHKSYFKSMLRLAITSYIIKSYIDFVFSILSYPLVYIHRCFIMYQRLYRRCFSKERIPDLINNNDTKILQS